MEDSRCNSTSGKIYLLLTGILWSTAGVCAKFIPWGALSITSFRGGIGTITLLLLIKKPRIRITLRNFMGAAALLGTGTLFMLANKLTTAANAIVLQYTAPIIVLLYTVVIKKKKPTWFELAIMAMVFSGCVLAFADKLDTGHILGNILGLGSGFTFAAMILINRDPKTNAQECQLLGNLMSFVVLLPFLLFDSKVTFDLPVIGVALYLGIFQYGLASFLFSIGIKKANPVTASILLTMEPICSPIWVFLFLGEAPGALAIAGFAVVVLSVTAYTLLPVLLKRPALCSCTYDPDDYSQEASHDQV